MSDSLNTLCLKSGTFDGKYDPISMYLFDIIVSNNNINKVNLHLSTGAYAMIYN